MKPTDFPKSFDLGRKPEVSMTASEVKSPENDEPRVNYPCVYVYDAPLALSAALREAPEDGVYALVKIVPVRSTETTEVRNGKEKESASVEFEIHEIRLPDELEADVEDDESESVEGEPASGEDKIIKAARKLGLKV